MDELQTYPWSRQELLEHAQTLIGKALSELYSSSELGSVSGKGSVGQLVQRAHFGLELDNRPEPDFPEIGVELKVTGVKESQDGAWRVKERLVMSIIDYHAIADESFESSAFVRKNALLLLIFYIYQANIPADEMCFLLADYWELLKRDLKNIRRDWQTIATKVRAGEAHTLSEADTLFLSAAVKGQGKGKDMRSQPFSAAPAKQRAFSLKPAYMNTVLEELLHRKQTVKHDDVHLVDEQEARSIEEVAAERLGAFQGFTEEEIASRLGIEHSHKEKSRRARYVRYILGVPARGEIAEFRRAGIIMKTVPLNADGFPTQPMSFRSIDYCSIAEEDWENSELRNTLINKMLVVFFRTTGPGRCRLSDDCCYLDKAIFWQMEEDFLDNDVRRVWEDTVEKIRSGNYEGFIKGSETNHVFVKTHGRNRIDLAQTPQGGLEKKRSFWIHERLTRKIYLGAAELF